MICRFSFCLASCQPQMVKTITRGSKSRKCSISMRNQDQLCTGYLLVSMLTDLFILTLDVPVPVAVVCFLIPQPLGLLVTQAVALSQLHVFLEIQRSCIRFILYLLL